MYLTNLGISIKQNLEVFFVFLNIVRSLKGNSDTVFSGSYHYFSDLFVCFF